MTVYPADRGVALVLTARELADLGLSPDRLDPAPLLPLLRSAGVDLPDRVRVETYARSDALMAFLRPAPRRPRHYISIT